MRPFFLFAHGAGANSSHGGMQRWKALLAEISEVVTFDYTYAVDGRRRPDPLPQLIAKHRQALTQARNRTKGRVVLIGKSMGGRVGCHVALEASVDGLVCLGYPLCGAGDPGKLRDKVLRALTTPILFVQGTRDRLCPLDLLERVRADMQAPNFLHVVDGGDHSLLVAKRQLAANGESQEEVDAKVVRSISDFVERLPCATE